MTSNKKIYKRTRGRIKDKDNSGKKGQKQPPEVFYKKGAFINIAKFTGKYLCQSLFLIKLQASTCSFNKKTTGIGVFL